MEAKRQELGILTKDECKFLEDIQARKLGRFVLLQDLERVLGRDAEEERAWWEGIRERLGIADSQGLRADHETGKVWRMLDEGTSGK